MAKKVLYVLLDICEMRYNHAVIAIMPKTFTENTVCKQSFFVLIIDNGLILFFLGIKLFFVFQDRKLKLSASVWKKISCNLTKFQLIQIIFSSFFFLSVVGLSWNCEVSRNSFSNRFWKKVSAVYLEKQKSFIPKDWI